MEYEDDISTRVESAQSSARLLAEAVEILVQAVVSWDVDPRDISSDIERMREFLEHHYARHLQEATDEANSSDRDDD